MTSEERTALREALIAQGFDRKSYTDDINGTGRYSEVWENEGNFVELQWGERS